MQTSRTALMMTDVSTARHKSAAERCGAVTAAGHGVGRRWYMVRREDWDTEERAGHRNGLGRDGTAG